MKVVTVEESTDYDGMIVRAVFSTRALAEDYVQRVQDMRKEKGFGDHTFFVVDEWEVDADGE